MAKEEPGESRLIGHGPCLKPSCGSSDAAARYSNGWIHCFSCGENYPDPENKPEGSLGPIQSKGPKVNEKNFIKGEYQSLSARGINADVCKRFHYEVGRVPEDYPASSGSVLHSFRGKQVHIENYYDDSGKLVGQKLRDRDKNFAVIGKVSGILWGRPVAKPGQKLLVITEGAIDALSYAQVRKNWPVVSIPNGAESAKASISANVEYLETFDKVVLCFDNDAPGKKAAEDCKGLLSPGKMFIGSLPEEYKDFNEALKAGDVKAIMTAVFNAEEVRPDGIVDIEDVLEDALKPIELGLPWWLEELTDLTYGRRYGEVYALGAGTGVGKTDFLTEQIAHDVKTLGLHVGILFLEQKPTETVKRIAGKIGNKRFHIPNSGWTPEDFKESVEPLKGKVTMYDSFGETEWSQVKTRIRHMNIYKGIRVFYVDHLTAMADTSDERGSLEQIMKEMAGLANELSIIIHFVSHLATPDGKPHEEGGRVMIRHFKGSRAIGFWSFLMIGLEREQQAEDETERHTTILRVLKDRYTGKATGHTIMMGYDTDTGRLLPIGMKQMDERQLKEAAEGF